MVIQVYAMEISIDRKRRDNSRAREKRKRKILLNRGLKPQLSPPPALKLASIRWSNLG